ncbi:MAG: hypothetical protein COW88_01045 [Candidatus Lloydbacteria bacterium CG22_combo_CG10-13_8_21_14_all_47_15]|uniref:Uncharacterized protein n=1 Tax=Candidatus Lloydbacteria bacterium CG22_combo_CG10-13_8_21_14_all_47_15 TaxID=1974635 RepID=A0A2H0CV10_9BACT|nr:MAG: hypothetical protein COW88_01045 [Candidatus Lloydbacteria bacterium CG22_combo_CG10-13_8_21_14_all_47_15]
MVCTISVLQLTHIQYCFCTIVIISSSGHDIHGRFSYKYDIELARHARRGEPAFPYLSALRAAKAVGSKPTSSILVRRAGFEPA